MHVDSSSEHCQVVTPVDKDKVKFTDSPKHLIVAENSRQQMTYTVFWSPQRFPFLFAYLIVIVLAVMFVVYLLMLRLISRRSGMVKKTELRAPLPLRC